MKKTMIMAAVCLGAAMSLPAQTMESLKVNLPVDSKIGNVTLPAGKYSIKELKNSVIEISSDSHRGQNVFATVNAVPAQKGDTDKTKVVLRKEDNGQYDLQSIWIEGQDLGYELTAAE